MCLFYTTILVYNYGLSAERHGREKTTNDYTLNELGKLSDFNFERKIRTETSRTNRSKQRKGPFKRSDTDTKKIITY